MAQKNFNDLRIVPGGAEHVQSFLNLWVPFVLAKRVFDRAWTYRLFPWERILVHPDYRTFVAIDEAEGVEGMIALGTKSDKPALHVAFLSTAPWNYGEGRMRRSVGTGLLKFAIDMSSSAGYGGAIILSATPEAESFYERLQFDRTGASDSEGLPIFHLSPQRAAALAKK